MLYGEICMLNVRWFHPNGRYISFAKDEKLLQTKRILKKKKHTKKTQDLRGFPTETIYLWYGKEPL